MRAKRGILAGLSIGCCLFGSEASAATLLYQWTFDNNAGTGTTVSPNVTPNNLTMAKANGSSPIVFTPANLYTAGGGGVTGGASDYAFDNSASVSNNPNPGGITYSSGVADANNANTVNALPNLTQFTLGMWVKPTTAELSVQSRLMEIATTVNFDESTNGLWVALNNGKIQTGGSSSNANFVLGNALVANAWNFVAVEVDLTAANVFFDPAMQTAAGGATIGATPVQDSLALYQGDNSSGVYGYTAQNGWLNGTMNFSGTQDYLQLLNRTSNATRAFQGQGDDFRIYSGLLSAAELQTIAAEAPAVPEPASLGIIFAGGLLLLRRRR